MVTRVYVTRRLPEPILEPLKQYEMAVWDGDGPAPVDELVRQVTNTDGLLTMLTDVVDVALLAAAPSLKVVSQMAVGVDNIDVKACLERGIVVGHTPGVLTETVADHAFALLGSIVRRLPEGMAEVKNGLWGPWEPFHLTGGELHGTVLGIVGMGRIGSAVAKRATGFDMEVIYTSPNSTGEVGRKVDLSELLARSDHVIVTAALTDDTRGLIGREQLMAMKSSAYLVNVSRGPLVDTAALFDALASAEIAGAALDVTDPEPLPADHRLLGLANCLVVPHLGSSSLATRTRMATLAVQNLIAGIEGRPLLHPVANDF